MDIYCNLIGSYDVVQPKFLVMPKGYWEYLVYIPFVVQKLFKKLSFPYIMIVVLPNMALS